MFASLLHSLFQYPSRSLFSASFLIRFLSWKPRLKPFRNLSTSSLSSVPLASSSMIAKFLSSSSSFGSAPVMCSSSTSRNALAYSFSSTPELLVSYFLKISSTLALSRASSTPMLPPPVEDLILPISALFLLGV